MQPPSPPPDLPLAALDIRSVWVDGLDHDAVLLPDDKICLLRAGLPPDRLQRVLDLIWDEIRDEVCDQLVTQILTTPERSDATPDA